MSDPASAAPPPSARADRANVWFTSDEHWGHANIIRYAGRPFAGVDEMDEQLVANWNAVVAPDDVVWVLGDVVMGNAQRTINVVERLAGTKHLVAGNHDRLFRRDRTTVREKWERIYRDAGFESIHHGYLDIELTPTLTVRAGHFPYEGDSHDDDRYVEHRAIDDGRPLLHGHSHGLWRQHGLMIDVGVDAWGGFPVDSSTLSALLDQGPAERAPLAWGRDAADVRELARSTTAR